MASQRDSLRLLKLRVQDLSKQLDVGLASYDDYLSAQIDANDTELTILSNQDAIRRSQASIILLSGVLID
jgi:outer membrane protein TolC